MLENEAQEHVVELSVGEGQVEQVGPMPFDLRVRELGRHPGSGLSQRSLGDVNRHELRLGTGCHQMHRLRTHPATDLEHPAASRVRRSGM